MDLKELRIELDAIDKQIVDLYMKRMDISNQVGAYKLERGQRILDPVREEEKLLAVSSMASGEVPKKGIRELYQQIMSQSRKLQYQMVADGENGGRLPFISVKEIEKDNATVVFQGVEGSYSQAAMNQYFGETSIGRSFSVDTFKDAFGAIEDGMADFAVIPIENSTAGMVHEVYDLLLEYELYIIREIFIPIKHVLAGQRGASLTDIETVYSHPQGLMQCGDFLSLKNWHQRGVSNTAVAAKIVASEGDKKQAAICSAYAASLYDLEVLDDNIYDAKENETRFIIVTNQKIFLEDAKKISICFEVPHKSGSLYHMLSHFIYNDLNMNKIESRPIEGRSFEYRFFVDFDGNLAQAASKSALRALREEAKSLKILGNY